MLKIEKTVTASPEQWEIIIEGMRNPMNSWGKMDSEPGCEIVEGSHEFCRECDDAIFIRGTRVCPSERTGFAIGPNDHTLMMNLAKNGPVHAKYRRMIPVWVTLTAPLYWWKEADKYQVATVTNSCSTMHKIQAKEFTMDDFSCEHMDRHSIRALSSVINQLNAARDAYLESKDKNDWWQMIQLLPSSYNQKRTWFLNYEVLFSIYHQRKGHRLDEWKTFLDWIEELAYSEIITLREE